MKLTPKKKADFQKTIFDFYKSNKRSSLPWRSSINPYKIWISEVMLQQTQVDRVIGFFNAWMDRFPTIADLAHASQIDVIKMWKGLGYNSRAIRLKRAAQEIVTKYNGVFPKTFETLIELPGIGPYTAGAILAFAYNQPVAFIETNIRRVYIHHFFKDSKSVHDIDILQLVQETVDQKNPRTWYWGLMDYGAYLGKTLKLNGKKFNPNIQSRHYSKQSKFQGSDREIRSRILQLLVSKNKLSISMLEKTISELSTDIERIETILTSMERDGFLNIRNNFIVIQK